MRNRLKQLTRESGIYGISHILTRSASFLLLPLHTNFLQPHDFGIAALLFAFMMIALPGYGLGLDSAFLRYFVLADSYADKIEIFSTIYWSMLAIASIATGLGFLFSPQISLFILQQQTPDLIQLCFGILFFESIVILPFLWLRAEKKSTLFAILKISTALVNMGLNYYFLVIAENGLSGLLKAYLGATVFSFVTILPLLIKNSRLYFSRAVLGRLLGFGTPSLVAAFAVLAMNNIDRFFLDAMLGATATGIYNAGYKLAMAMTLIVAAFRFAWHPFFLAASKQADAPQLFARILTYFMLVVVTLLLIFAFFTGDIVTLKWNGYALLGEAYWEGLSVMVPVMAAQILFGIYVILLAGIHLKEKTGSLPFITLAALLTNCAGNIFLIPLWGLSGAALSTFLGYLVLVILLYRISRKIYPVPYEHVRLIKLVAVGALLLFLHHYFETGLLFNFLLLAGYPVLLYLSNFLNPDERTWLAKKMPT